MVKEIFGEKVVKVKIGNAVICDKCGLPINNTIGEDIVHYYKAFAYKRGNNEEEESISDLCSDECVKKYIDDYLSNGVKNNLTHEISIRGYCCFPLREQGSYEEGESYEEKDIT